MKEYFLELLRAGLWSCSPSVELFENASYLDWEEIHYLAKGQAVTGIVFDGMEKLPVSIRPPRGLLMQWFAEVNAIERQNQKLNSTLVELFRLCLHHGVSPLLLKGQGIAQSYEKPDHRMCGDIDLYLGIDGCKVIDPVLEEITGMEADLSDGDSTFVWNQVVIESHKTLTHLFNPVSHRKQKRILRKHLDEKEFFRIFGEAEIRVPAPGMDVLFIFLHIAKHFMVEGIGLRQICDWARILYISKGKYDPERLKKELDDLKLTRLANVFGALMIRHLGFPVSFFPWDIPEKDAENVNFLLEEILISGNFGKNRNLKGKAPKKIFFRKYYTFQNLCRRSFYLLKLCPSEALCLPFKFFVNQISQMICKKSPL